MKIMMSATTLDPYSTPKMIRPNSVRGDVDGSVNNRCMPRKTAMGMGSWKKKWVPVAAVYTRPNVYVVATAENVMAAVPNRNCAGKVTTKMSRKMCGGLYWVVEISGPHEMPVEPVRSKPSENTVSVNDEGLKMWVCRPSLFHRISSLAAKPTATMRN